MAKKRTGLEALPLWFKVILALPALDICWMVFRVYKSIVKRHVFGIILGVALLIIGIPFMWIVDIFSLILTGRVLWID